MAVQPVSSLVPSIVLEKLCLANAQSRYGHYLCIMSRTERRLLGVGVRIVFPHRVLTAPSFLGGVTRSLNISYLKAIPLGTY
jgi:hypothetical protein